MIIPEGAHPKILAALEQNNLTTTWWLQHGPVL